MKKLNNRHSLFNRLGITREEIESMPEARKNDCVRGRLSPIGKSLAKALLQGETFTEMGERYGMIQEVVRGNLDTVLIAVLSKRTQP